MDPDLIIKICEQRDRVESECFSNEVVGLDSRKFFRRVGKMPTLLELAVFHSLDVGTEHEKLLVDVLVATVDVVKPTDFGGTLGGKRSKNERGGGAEVRGHDRGGRELSDAADDGGAIVHLDVGSHALELGAMHETLRENCVLDHADAGGGD